MNDIFFGFHAVESQLNSTNADALLLVDRKHKNPRTNACIVQAKACNIKVKYTTINKLNALTKGNHQGVVLQVFSDKQPLDSGDALVLIKSLPHSPLILILDGITDPHNLGACLRSADGVGADAVIAPKDKSTGLTPVVHKIASGAQVPFFQVSNLARFLRQLIDAGIWLVATDDKADTKYYACDFNQAVAIVLGNEGTGIRKLTKSICQELVAIPMAGSVSSLNVSVAAGVILFEAMRQRQRNSLP